MTKKLPKGKPAKTAVRPKAGRGDNLLDVLKSLDEATLERLREELGFGEGDIEEDDPVRMFDLFLDKMTEHGEEEIDADDQDFLSDFVLALTQLAIDDSGGDPRARESRAAINDKLEEALSAGLLEAPALVMLGKILSDSGWRVPENLKNAVVQSLEAAGPSAEGVGPSDLESTLSEIAEAADGDAFAAYDALNSILAAFPSKAAARMVGVLGAERSPVLAHTLAGFAMHRDGAIALAAIAELKGAAAGGPVESALVERLVRMRPWLPQDRQGPLDETIRTLRAHTRPPVDIERPKPAKCFVLACDGSGSGGALATLKASDGWRFVAALGKTSGLEEVLSLEGAPKAQVEATVRDMRENVIAAQTDVAGVAEYLRLALGENLALKTPPPFRLIAFVENLGLGPVAPRPTSPADLIDSLLEDLPAARKDAAAVALAHSAVVGGALDTQWFEAGEPVERLLAPIRGAKARVKTVLTVYLPERRAFWLRAVAMTAFVLQMDRKTYGGLGASLALVGREIASDAPLESIPLMRQIAEMTVEAYQSRF